MGCRPKLVKIFSSCLYIYYFKIFHSNGSHTRHLSQVVESLDYQAADLRFKFLHMYCVCGLRLNSLKCKKKGSNSSLLPLHMLNFVKNIVVIMCFVTWGIFFCSSTVLIVKGGGGRIMLLFWYLTPLNLNFPCKQENLQLIAIIWSCIFQNFLFLFFSILLATTSPTLAGISHLFFLP